MSAVEFKTERPIMLLRQITVWLLLVLALTDASASSQAVNIASLDLRESSAMPESNSFIPSQADLMKEKVQLLDDALQQSNLTDAERAAVRATKLRFWTTDPHGELSSARALRRILEDPDVRRYLDFKAARLPLRSWERFVEARSETMLRRPASSLITRPRFARRRRRRRRRRRAIDSDPPPAHHPCARRRQPQRRRRDGGPRARRRAGPRARGDAGDQLHGAALGRLRRPRPLRGAAARRRRTARRGGARRPRGAVLCGGGRPRRRGGAALTARRLGPPFDQSP
jgi:hypothetical protein